MKYTLQIFTKNPYLNISESLIKIASNLFNIKFKYFFGVNMYIFESNLNINDIKKILIEFNIHDFILINTTSQSNTVNFDFDDLLTTFSYDNNPEIIFEKVKKYGNDSLTLEEHKILQEYLK